MTISRDALSLFHTVDSATVHSKVCTPVCNVRYFIHVPMSGENRTLFLILDSHKQAASAALKLLKPAFSPCEFITVSTKPDFITCLRESPPDVIVSEYLLDETSFTAADAIRLSREADAHTPFIIFSSHSSDDAVINCMRAGAFDYIPIRQQTRLVTAVRSASPTRREEFYGQMLRFASWSDCHGSILFAKRLLSCRLFGSVPFRTMSARIFFSAGVRKRQVSFSTRKSGCG